MAVEVHLCHWTKVDDPLSHGGFLCLLGCLQANSLLIMLDQASRIAYNELMLRISQQLNQKETLCDSIPTANNFVCFKL